MQGCLLRPGARASVAPDSRAPTPPSAGAPWSRGQAAAARGAGSRQQPHPGSVEEIREQTARRPHQVAGTGLTYKDRLLQSRNTPTWGRMMIEFKDEEAEAGLAHGHPRSRSWAGRRPAQALPSGSRVHVHQPSTAALTRLHKTRDVKPHELCSRGVGGQTSDISRTGRKPRPWAGLAPAGPRALSCPSHRWLPCKFPHLALPLRRASIRTRMTTVRATRNTQHYHRVEI